MAFRGDELFAFKGVDDNAFVCFTSSSAPVLYEHEKAFKYSVSAQDHVTVFERSGSLMFAANTLGVCIVVVHHGVTPFVGGKLLLDSAVSVLRGCESASDAVSVLKRVLTGQEVKGCTLVVADKGMLVIEMDFVLGRRVEHKNAVMLSRMRFEPTEGQEIHCFREETFKARCLSVTSHFDVTKKTPFSSVSDAFAFLRHHKTSEPCFSANGMCCCIYRTDGVPCRGSDVCIDWTCDRFGVVFDLKAARVFLIQGSRLCHTSFVPLNLALPPPNPKLVKLCLQLDGYFTNLGWKKFEEESQISDMYDACCALAVNDTSNDATWARAAEFAVKVQIVQEPYLGRLLNGVEFILDRDWDRPPIYGTSGTNMMQLIWAEYKTMLQQPTCTEQDFSTFFKYAPFMVNYQEYDIYCDREIMSNSIGLAIENKAALRAILKAGANPNWMTDQCMQGNDYERETCFAHAMKTEDLETASLLLQYGLVVSQKELALCRQRSSLRIMLQKRYAQKIAKLILLIWTFRRGNLRAMRVLPRDMIRLVAMHIIKSHPDPAWEKCVFGALVTVDVLAPKKEKSKRKECSNCNKQQPTKE